ncbi:MAG: hypothetical protein K2H52_14040 [Lachnospiraceae bacterium]|nr:hypothetical protein [Lachnospiraceae bacterium]MDE6184615.1 hypothetical protein [Lachnospiraceae bacterium]
MNGEWIKIQGCEYKNKLPREDCMIWITRTMFTGERWVQRVEYYAGENIEQDGTVAWMPDQEERPEPYTGHDVIAVQNVRN